MNAAELFGRLTEYGADMKGIADRFVGDDELYLSCFEEMLAEPNLDALQKAFDAKDYDAAFAAAHALKGLAGNLGLTPFYQAICALVETLRSKDYGDAPALNTVVQAELARLRALAAGQPFQKEPVSPPVLSAPRKPKKPRDRMIIRASVALVVVLVFVIVLFSGVLGGYRQNVLRESAAHLEEVVYQVGLYIEQKVENDWRIAHAVADNIMDGAFASDEAVFRMLRAKRDVWKLTQIVIYTENGYGRSTDGTVAMNDEASRLTAMARLNGEYMSIVESAITYTVPVDAEACFNGSRIVAVSVVQDMETFLDDMRFNSFDGAARMYLTEADGMVISRLTGAVRETVFNISTLIENDQMFSLSGDRLAADSLNSAEPATVLIPSDQGEQYVVETPVVTRNDNLKLFYFAPKAAVNRATDGFADYVTLTSAAVILLFVTLSIVVFMYVYRTRKRQFDAALLARNHAFDLLVRNTSTAFGLIRVGEPQPEYSSSNARQVIGVNYFLIEKTADGYRFVSDTGADTPTLRQINEGLKIWDGVSPYSSGFIRNDDAENPGWFDFRLFPVEGEKGEVVCVAQDATKTHEREAAVKAALAIAEGASQAKTRFLSNMSHDIRTPMNAIMNMADFALSGLDNKQKLREYLNVIRESSDHLLLLINDILDMSRIESGKAVVNLAPMSLKKELNALADLARPLCMAKDQTLIADFAGIGSGSVMGDRLKLSQILTNLLSNAVKFTPRGGAVRFTAREVPSLRDNYVDVCFSVEDNGTGISKAFLPHIFEPFARENQTRAGGEKGSGLGLSICHSYVVAMGGAIRVESEKGEGSVFTVDLYFEKTDAAPAPKPEAPAYDITPFLGKRCLVCEDNPTNMVIARTMLERLGFLVEEATNGREGVSRFVASAVGYFDVIFMDIQMPVLDGYEAAVAIRECDRPDARVIPIIAMTANVFIDDIEKARIAGMDGHVGKPVSSVALVNETNKALEKKRRMES